MIYIITRISAKLFEFHTRFHIIFIYYTNRHNKLIIYNYNLILRFTMLPLAKLCGSPLYRYLHSWKADRFRSKHDQNDHGPILQYLLTHFENKNVPFLLYLFVTITSMSVAYLRYFTYLVLWPHHISFVHSLLDRHRKFIFYGQGILYSEW